jgi:hypothetical protein
VTDPYAPFPAAPARPAPFPRERLLRTGLNEDTVDRLASEFDALDGQQRVEFGRYVTAHSDDVIRERFAEGVQGVEQPEPVEATATPTYEELNALTVDELDDRLREWNEAHPDQHLTIAGRKGEKIGRLLDAYEQEASQPAPTVEVSEPVAAAIAGTEQPTGGTTVAEQQLPTAPTATTPAGAPEAAPAAPVAPAGTVETGDASTGAQTPAQTADAAGAGPTA